jgi:hypothetical protein
MPVAGKAVDEAGPAAPDGLPGEDQGRQAVGVAVEEFGQGFALDEAGAAQLTLAGRREGPTLVTAEQPHEGSDGLWSRSLIQVGEGSPLAARKQ